MRGRTKAGVGGGLVTGFSLVWLMLDRIVTAATLPADLRGIWKAVIDSPQIVPWILFLGGLAVLLWSVWPGGRSAEAQPEPAPSLHASRFQTYTRLRETMPHLPMFGDYETPFRSLVRRVAFDSQWGLDYMPKPWPTWQDDLKREVLRGLATRSIRAQGVRNEREKMPDSAPSQIDAEFWTKADFTPEHMLVDDDVSMVFHKGEPCPHLYTEIMLDSSDVDRVWPAVPARKRRGRRAAFSGLARQWRDEQESAWLNRNPGVAFDVAWQEAAKGVRPTALAPASADRLIPFVALREIAPELRVPLPQFGPGQNNAYYLEGALRQAAVRGELRVEGRRHRGPVRDNEPLVPISPEHFRDFGFAHGVLNYEEQNEASHTGNTRMMTNGERGIEGVTFYDLHISERDARAVVQDFAKDARVERP